MQKEQISFTSGGKIRDLGEMLSKIGLDQSEEVYRHLLKGEHLSIQNFANLLGKSASESEEILSLHGEVNELNQIVGFLGISLIETNHKMIVDGITIYTWCAADTFIFPRYLDFTAQVESKDPISGEIVKLSVNGDYLEWTDPVPLYISSMDMADSCDIRNSFCNHTHFFVSKENANLWLENNPEGKISLLEDFISFSGGSRCC